MRIKDLTPSDRPRERLFRQGASSLSDAELIALLIGNGVGDKNAVELGSVLLSRFGIKELRHVINSELCAVPGIGPAKAARIVAMMEFSRRCEMVATPHKILSVDDAIQYCKPLIAHYEQEHFLVVYLDARNQVRGHEVITRGLVGESLVHPREVFRNAVRMNAHSIIVAHNHPSGDSSPSDEDGGVTAALVAAGKVMGIPVLDHIIVAATSARSIIGSSGS